MPQPNLIIPGSPQRLLLPSMYPPGLKDDYLQRILHTRPGNLIGCWPQDEPPDGSTVAHDYSGNNNHGRFVGVQLGQPGFGDGRTCGVYDGLTRYTNIYSPGLAAMFDGAEGALLTVAKVPPGVWTDGVTRRVITLRSGGTNQVYVERSSAVANQLNFVHIAGAVTTTVSTAALGGYVRWMVLGITWSKLANQMRSYAQGSQTGLTQSPVGTWAGSLFNSLTNLGATSTIPSDCWSGAIALTALWAGCALTPAEVAWCSRLDVGVAA